MQSRYWSKLEAIHKDVNDLKVHMAENYATKDDVRLLQENTDRSRRWAIGTVVAACISVVGALAQVAL